MPKITDISVQKNNKTRANLFLDGEFFCGLEIVTIMKLGLKIGQEVSHERISQAVLDSDKSVAFGKAMDYIAKSMKTTSQVRQYLAKKGYNSQAVDYVIERMVELKYLDDATYAKLYAQQNAKTKGERRIKQELVTKGIVADVAEQASEQTEEDALQNALALAQKYTKNKPIDIKTLQKLQRFLLYRGFAFDVVNAVVAEYRNNMQDVADDQLPSDDQL